MCMILTSENKNKQFPHYKQSKQYSNQRLRQAVLYKVKLYVDKIDARKYLHLSLFKTIPAFL